MNHLAKHRVINILVTTLRQFSLNAIDKVMMPDSTRQTPK